MTIIFCNLVFWTFKGLQLNKWSQICVVDCSVFECFSQLALLDLQNRTVLVSVVRLSSIYTGFLYDHGHLARAVCCRLDREPPPLDTRLPAGFHLNHPWLGRVTACQPLRETQKTKAYSINWTVGDAQPEVLDGTLGHCYTA